MGTAGGGGGAGAAEAARRHYLPGGGDPRRHAAFRLRGRRSGEGHRARGGGKRRAGRFRRADVQHAGAGHRPRGGQGRQQGIRRRHGRHRDGQPDAPVAPGERRCLPAAGLARGLCRFSFCGMRAGSRWKRPPQPTYDTLYSEESRTKPQRDAFLDQLVAAPWSTWKRLDRRITQHAAHWRIERMPTVDRNILRLAVYEMMHSRYARAGGDRRSAGAGAALFE